VCPSIVSCSFVRFFFKKTLPSYYSLLLVDRSTTCASSLLANGVLTATVRIRREKNMYLIITVQRTRLNDILLLLTIIWHIRSIIILLSLLVCAHTIMCNIKYINRLWNIINVRVPLVRSPGLLTITIIIII